MRLNNFKKKLICWGAADQAIVLQPIIESLGAQYDIVVDDTPNKVSPFENVQFLGGKKKFEQWLPGRPRSEYGFVIAIGNPYGFIRCALHEYLISMGITPVSICAPSALLDPHIQIGEGAQIMKGAIINTHAKIGKQTIINTRSTVEHHVALGDGVEIAPSATLCGRVTVHNYSWICAGATVLPRVSIGANSIIGAGALIRTDVPNNAIFAGVPAKFIKHNLVGIKVLS